MVGLLVTSHRKTTSYAPIRIGCQIGDLDVDLRYQDHVKILCQVSRGYDAVIRARVTATVLTPKSSYFNIPLFDDGAGN